MRTATTAATLVALCIVFTACGSEAPDDASWAGNVRDSAGISIVTNPGAGAWTDDERWSVTEELAIGVDVGDPELQFGLVSGLDVDDQGRIFVLDQQASRVRVFSPEGQLLHAFGRPGQGPGEQAAMGLFVTADQNLLVPDLLNQRVARFTPEGEPLAGPVLDISRGVPMQWTTSADRTIFQQSRIMSLPGMPVTDAEPHDLILTRGPDGEVSDTVASLSAGETFRMTGGAPEIRLFAPENVWTVLSDGRLVTAKNSAYSFEVRDASGQVQTIVRRGLARRPVTQGDKDAFLQAMQKAWSDAGMPQEMATQMGQMIQFADEWPALGQIQGGPASTLWVQSVDPQKAFDLSAAMDLQNLDLGSGRWDVFDADGRYLGDVALPAGFLPRRFHGDHVYGVQVNDLGVQRVLRLRIDQGR